MIYQSEDCDRQPNFAKSLIRNWRSAIGATRLVVCAARLMQAILVTWAKITIWGES